MERTIALIDLVGKKFIIPHYQLGYHWKPEEVKELLDYITAFEKRLDNKLRKTYNPVQQTDCYLLQETDYKDRIEIAIEFIKETIN